MFIAKIRMYLTSESTKTLVHAYVTCRLDNCNSLLLGSPEYIIQKRLRPPLAPPYVSQLIVPYNPTRNLRSASKHLLEVPNVRLKSYGDRAFSVAAPKHWNDIPLDIKLSGSVDVFKSRLKTYLFRLAFN